MGNTFGCEPSAPPSSEKAWIRWFSILSLSMGIWSNDLVISVMMTNYLIKVGWEAVITPFTYLVVNFLKRAENEDYYDRKTNFTPFSIEV